MIWEEESFQSFILYNDLLVKKKKVHLLIFFINCVCVCVCPVFTTGEKTLKDHMLVKLRRRFLFLKKYFGVKI